MKLPKFNINSTQHMSLILFGGELEITVQEPVLDENGFPVFIKTGLKAGEIKLKNQKKKVKIRGMGLNPLNDWKTKKDGIYQSNQAVLELVAGDFNE